VTPCLFSTAPPSLLFTSWATRARPGIPRVHRPVTEGTSGPGPPVCATQRWYTASVPRGALGKCPTQAAHEGQPREPRRYTGVTLGEPFRYTRSSSPGVFCGTPGVAAPWRLFRGWRRRWCSCRRWRRGRRPCRGRWRWRGQPAPSFGEWWPPQSCSSCRCGTLQYSRCTVHCNQCSTIDVHHAGAVHYSTAGVRCTLVMYHINLLFSSVLYCTVHIRVLYCNVYCMLVWYGAALWTASRS